MGNRQGKHKESKVNIGLYVDEDFRALLALVVDQTGDTATNILMEGVRERATQIGIMANGAILPEYRPIIEVIKEAFRIKRQMRKGRK